MSAFPSDGDTVARTMGVTTFSLFRIVSSLETADETRSVFSGYMLGNPALLKGTGLSIVTIVLATELGHPQERARHDQPDRPAVARVHRRGPVADRGRGSQEGTQDPHGRGAGPDTGAGRLDQPAPSAGGGHRWSRLPAPSISPMYEFVRRCQQGTPDAYDGYVPSCAWMRPESAACQLAAIGDSGPIERSNRVAWRAWLRRLRTNEPASIDASA